MRKLSFCMRGFGFGVWLDKIRVIDSTGDRTNRLLTIAVGPFTYYKWLRP